MSLDRPLNASDYLMLGFDYELRRRGFAGNTCQIVLELGGEISVAALEKRVALVAESYPILNARPAGWRHSGWRIPGGKMAPPRVQVHENEPSVPVKLFNQRLDMRRGELVRFDLIRAKGRSTLVFSWAHALMDAPGAEYFLAAVGHEDLALPAGHATSPPQPKAGLLQRIRVSWKYLRYLDKFHKAAPLGIGGRHPAAPAELRYRVERFSVEETARARANGVRVCGLLGDAQFHAATALCELHQLHERLGYKGPSYALPLVVGLRPKGSIEPLFSNEISVLMLQFLPEHLTDTAAAATAFRRQVEEGLREGLLQCGRTLGELFRIMPLPVYMTLLKQGLRGEICSLFFGDTAAVHPRLTTFLGVPVDDFAHVAAVTPSPGVGVICYSFRGQLRLTVVYSARALTDAEAEGFGARLRARLLAS